MKAWMAGVGLASWIGVAAHAQSEWFTVSGDPTDAAANTVQVDPIAIAVDGMSRTMNVRVNRSSTRLNWDKIAYRSYESQVLFDCQTRRAGYLQARYYTQPLWQGEPVATVDYTGDVRPMLFRDIEPNPTGRLVRAACRTRTG